MSSTLFLTALYAALVVCVLGLTWRASVWFRLRIGPEVRDVRLSQRVAAVFRGGAGVLSSRTALRMLVVLFLDVLLQRKLFLDNRLRWFGHLLILIGFTLLLLMHALAGLLSAKLFPEYQSTLNPYLFLRNLSGAMVLIGVSLLYFGRWRTRASTNIPQVRRRMDAAFVALLGFVLVTGFALEAGKIASPRAFYRMAEQFVASSDAQKLEPLRALWAQDFGVAFEDMKPPFEQSLMEEGRKLHREVCASCHSRPQSAFVSYSLARMLAPISDDLKQGRADSWLLHFHVLACFLGLATLPFTRFFHVVAATISLLVNAVAPTREFSVAGRALRRALAIDACVRCGICDIYCSVASLARYFGNPYLLPAHKLLATSALASGGLLQPGRKGEALRVAEGAFLCTDCGRCTIRCPVGLDLQDLWEAGRSDLAAAGFSAPAQWIQARPALAWADVLEPRLGEPGIADTDTAIAPLSSNRDSFSRCVQCQTCTNVCPVVAHSNGSDQGVDLTPQKVMNLLRLGLRDLTLGSRMVWGCATCYQCQEHCPESIRVADIMWELRALSVCRLGAVHELEEAL